MVTSIFRRSRAANSVVSGGIWPKFKPIQAFMYEKDPIKNSGEKCDELIFLMISLWDLFQALKGR